MRLTVRAIACSALSLHFRLQSHRRVPHVSSLRAVAGLVAPPAGVPASVRCFVVQLLPPVLPRARASCLTCPPLAATAESGRNAVRPQHYKLPGVAVAMIHDIAVTPDFYVVVVGPVNFSPSKVCFRVHGRACARVALARVFALHLHAVALAASLPHELLSHCLYCCLLPARCCAPAALPLLLQFLFEYTTSRCSIAECLVYNPSQPTKVHLVPRPRGNAGERHGAWCTCAETLAWLRPACV